MMDINPGRRKDWGRHVEVYWEGDGVFYRWVLCWKSAVAGHVAPLASVSAPSVEAGGEHSPGVVPMRTGAPLSATTATRASMWCCMTMETQRRSAWMRCLTGAWLGGVVGM